MSMRVNITHMSDAVMSQPIALIAVFFINKFQLWPKLIEVRFSLSLLASYAGSAGAQFPRPGISALDEPSVGRSSGAFVGRKIAGF